MKTKKPSFLIVAAAAVSLIISGCSCENPVESGQLAEADRQLQRDLTMYVGVWDQIINEGMIDLINEEHFTNDITLVSGPENIVGIEAFKEYYNHFVMGFSDVEFTVEEAFGQGNRIVKHWKFKGTHTGEFFGIPATGKAIDFEGVTLVTMKDGRIALEQDFFDNLVFMQQLGIIPTE